MKKILCVAMALLIGAGFSFAQSEVSALPEDEIKVDLSKKTYSPENMHLNAEDRSGKVVIEFVPMVDEVRIYYTCMYTLYEKDNAMTAIHGCLEDFTKENKYYHYKYLGKDKEKYYKDNRGIKWAEYSAHVQFSR